MSKYDISVPAMMSFTGQLESAVKRLASHSPRFDWVGIYLLEDDTLKLGPYVGEATEHDTIRVGQGVCGTAVAEDRDQNIADVSQQSNYLACSPKTRSELVVLIRDSQGRVRGQIDIDSHTPDAFGSKEEEEVKRVANELGSLWPEQKK